MGLQMRRASRALIMTCATFGGGWGLAAAQMPDPGLPKVEVQDEALPKSDLLSGVAAGQAAAAVREAANPNAVTLPLPAGCDNRPNAIGLSRVVEIDTTGGPRLGRSQYKDLDFLQDGEIVLTFDDGPIRRYTKPVLDTLDAHCTRATFFSVGRMAIADPETLKETARRGHTIASHTWSHAKFTTISAAKATYEIELGNSAVTKALGAPIAPFFRFPYLRDTKAALAYLQSRNMSTFSIEVDSQDFRTRNPGQVLRNVMAQLKIVKKGIILFHDIQPATAGALSSLLDNLKAGGFKVVHLVSKYPNTTLPDYDALIEKEMERKRLALAAQPLADRAVTWPNAAGALLPENVPKALPGKPGPNQTGPNQPGPNQMGQKQTGAGKPPAAPGKSGPPANAGDTLPWEGASATRPGPPAGPPGVTGAPPNAASLPQAAPDPDLPPPPLRRTVRKPLWQGLDDDPWRIRTLGD